MTWSLFLEVARPLTGCGFFEVRRPILTALTGAVATYMVVMLQFKVSDEWWRHRVQDFNFNKIINVLLLLSYMQCRPLNGITLGQTRTASINWIITISKYISNTKYAVEKHLGFVQSGSAWPNYPIKCDPIKLRLL